jgi:hypothetical protein
MWRVARIQPGDFTKSIKEFSLMAKARAGETMRNLIAGFRADPRRSTLQIIAALMAFPAFYCVVHFISAETPAEIAARGHGIPPHWSAGVLGHGEYSPWWTIHDRPVFFGLSVAVLIVCLGYIWISVLSGSKRSEPR